MDATTSRGEIYALLTRANRETEGSEPGKLKRLFDLFVEIETALEKVESTATEDDRSTAVVALDQAKCVVLNSAALSPVVTTKDVFLKLALWRRDLVGRHASYERRSRADAVALSAYRNLANIVGEELVASIDAR